MFTLLFILSLLLFSLESSAAPSRIKRQENFSGNNEEPSFNLDPIGFTTTPSNSAVTSRTTPSTTTQPPGFVTCTRACITTPEYNPVCGSNRVTYMNLSRFRCANRCGAGITLDFNGTCAPL